MKKYIVDIITYNRVRKLPLDKFCDWVISVYSSGHKDGYDFALDKYHSNIDKCNNIAETLTDASIIDADMLTDILRGNGVDDDSISRIMDEIVERGTNKL